MNDKMVTKQEPPASDVNVLKMQTRENPASVAVKKIVSSFKKGM